MEKCRTLSNYAYLVAEVRKSLETMGLNSAVEKVCEIMGITVNEYEKSKTKIVTFTPSNRLYTLFCDICSCDL